MSVTVKIINQIDLDGFRRLSNFDMLKRRRNEIVCSTRNYEHEWWNNDKNCKTYRLNVLFVGQTGTGKSTTINSLIGNYYMLTDDVACCTKDMNSVDFELADDCFLCFCDMPGIGENSNADAQYYEWYNSMYNLSDCVVYLLRADKRDYAIDLEEFNNLKSLGGNKLIIGLNCVDKIPPINRSYNFSLSYEQKENLSRKIKDISNLFGIPQCDVIPFSAAENYNLTALKQIISETLLINLRLYF